MSLEGKSEQEIAALAQLADSVLNNPKTRTAFQRQLKVANPEISLPEIDTQDAIISAVKPHVDALKKTQDELQQMQQDKSANNLYESLHDDRVCASRKDFGELVQYAAAKGFQTSEDGLRMAASHRRSEMEAAEPTPLTAGLPSILDKGNKDLMKDPNGWARAEASKAIAELAKRQAA